MMNGRPRLAVLAVLAVGLGGCAVPGFGTGETAARPTAPEPIIEAEPAAEHPRLAALRARFPNAKSLIGLAAAEAEDALGAPAFKRKDAPAEIWQYASEVCRLDLFLYRRGEATRVEHLEARDAKKPTADANPDPCLVSILARRVRTSS